VPAPPELSQQSAVERLAGLPDATAVGFGLETVVSLLARGVVLVVATELVLRGFVLPVLVRRLGRGWGIVLVVLASLATVRSPGLVLPAAALSAVLCVLRLGTGSIVPGLGVASGATGALLGVSLGRPPLAAAAAAAGCAAAAAGPALALARLAGVAPAPAAAPGRLRGERGSTAVDYVAVLLVVAACIGALFAVGLPERLQAWVRFAICVIERGPCADGGAVDPTCLVSSSTSSGSAAVNVAIVKVGEDSTLIRQEYADGRVVFTLIKSGTVAAELIAGAKAKGGKIGFDATASVSAGGRLDGAMTFTFTDPEKAREFEEQVRSHGSFGQVVRDVVEGPDVFGIGDWVLDHTVGKDVDPEDLPTPDSTYISVNAVLTGEAGISANVIAADAGLKGLIEASGGARVYTSGKDAGNVELNIKLTGEAAARLGLLTLGPGINGKAEFIATVTLDQDEGYQPTKLRIVGRAGYNGDNLDFGLNPTSGQLGQISKAIQAAAVGSQSGSGHQVEFQADLTLDDPAARADIYGLLSGRDPAGSTADIVRRIEEDGRLTVQTYDTTASNTEAGVLVGLGVNVGVEGSQRSESRDLGSSWVREPGDAWTQRNCGPRT
jgi:Type II CAAX prenyl endopeptidase Rce1-like